MKKLMKFTAWVLVLLLTMTSLPAFAESDRVEVRFSIGDSVLSINGTDVHVETPYVVGEGVTLVPLRVITEAFGAKVEWIAETQTINLSYPDVEIVLQIANPIAEVNGKAETLLSSPELTSNGYTMVPLRFISETFGATVSYDEATRGIIVVKENIESGTTVIGTINTKNIGDSYYGWSMENPSGAQMEEREFDGTYTVFSFDENSWFDISIYLVEEDYDFERDFIEWKNGFSGYTLIKADKDSSDPKKKIMHFQVKNKTSFGDVWIYITPKYKFLIWGSFELENTTIHQEGIRLLETFDCSFDNSDTYDLSNSENGMRKFTIENLGFSMNIPDDFVKVSSDNLENEVGFMKMDSKDDDSQISIGIYSKSDVGTAAVMAENDYNGNREALNEDVSVFGDLVEKEYNGFKAWEYNVEIDAVSSKRACRDVFIELGDYIYNVNITFKMPDNLAESITNTILNSIELKEADASKVGILMRNLPDDEGTFVISEKGWNLTIPHSYEEIQNAADGVVLQNMMDGTSLIFSIADSGGASTADVRRYMQEIESNIKNQTDIKIIQTTKQVIIGGVTYSELICTQETEEEDLVYVRQLAGIKSGKVVSFSIVYYELAYSKYNIATTDEIIASMNITY